MRPPIGFILMTIAITCGVAASASFKHFLMENLPSNDTSRVAFDWPPQVDALYPDLKLSDIEGKPVRLSQFRGKLLLIEPVGIGCRGCQAFAGGHVVGGLFGYQPQSGLKSIHEYAETYSGTSLDDDRIHVIQILFYGPYASRAPTLDEAKKWAEHYRAVAPHATVLVAQQSMVNKTTRGMIPGFHLVDRDFILRCAAGNPPHQDLYRDLLPLLGELVGDRQSTE